MMSQQQDGDYKIRRAQKQLKKLRKIICKLHHVQQVEKDPENTIMQKNSENSYRDGVKRING